MFLDSHCECNVGWLEPMLERIHRNRTTVVCPVIDVISWEKIEYSTVRGPPGVRGGFNWGLQFKWKKIPNYEQKRRGYDETREVKSPTMAGGLFAIDTKFFFEIGSYDTGMDIWGAENLEISFRVSCLNMLCKWRGRESNILLYNHVASYAAIIIIDIQPIFSYIYYRRCTTDQSWCERCTLVLFIGSVMVQQLECFAPESSLGVNYTTAVK